jgi:NAD(P) transhydrogenase subunit alpha
MKVGIPKEIYPGENRVAATPETAKRIKDKLGFDVVVESGAGMASQFEDQAYSQAGCELVDRAEGVFRNSDIILKVRGPESHEVDLLDESKTIISFLFPAQNEELLRHLAERGTTALAMDAVPRISRAQKMDALSSMANIAGYRAVIEAANAFGRFFTGQITAAGKVPPAKVLVIGAGVAGLAAIGAARGLGAIVRAFDVRPEVADQVKSMGAEFLMLEFEGDQSGGTAGGYAKTMSKEFIDAEMALFAAQAKEVDIIITTALIPGKPSPKLITREMVESMRTGSVIVDLATEQGGNCEVSERDKVINHGGVKIIGYSDLPTRLPSTASQLYGTNLFHVLDELGGAEAFELDMNDVVIRNMVVVHRGEVSWPPPPVSVSAQPTADSMQQKVVAAENSKRQPSKWINWLAIAVAVLALAAVAMSRDSSLLTDVTVFVLACIIGWQVIWNVTAALHTPLMSVTNAISGIIIIGGMVQVETPTRLAYILGAVAIFFASINIAGGFLVTHRMLKMFHK